MLEPTLRRGGFVLVAILVAAAGSSAHSEPVTKVLAFSAAELVKAPAQSWITNGGNVYNQRYSTLSQINRGNIDQLKAVWRVSLNGSGLGQGYSQQAQALFHEGVLYVVTGADDVFAVSPEMRRYVATGIANDVRIRGPQQGLFDALYSRNQLQLEYESTMTRNAAQAYAARAGNCLSLVIMTAAFAKEMGLKVTQLPGGEIVPAMERGVIDAFEYNNPTSDMRFGAQDVAKKIVKAIKDQEFKKVQVQIQGEEIRVTAPARDELQAVIAFLRGQDFGIELKFGNYRS